METIQIIATIGPSCKDAETITAMVHAGMSVARLNFSWGTHEEHTRFAIMIRAAATEKGVTIPIIQDLSGPRVQSAIGHSFDTVRSVITEKDIADLAFTQAQNPEYVAMSFVRNAQDIKDLRAILLKNGVTSKIIAKIERQEALDSLDEIIVEADGIMVARGDLGETIPMETLPFVKKDILKRARLASKPTIVATEMLTSMTDDIDPSRADISDIAQAVQDGASATMLSNETATGKFPVETVACMRLVVDEALRHTEVPSPVRF